MQKNVSSSLAQRLDKSGECDKRHTAERQVYKKSLRWRGGCLPLS